MKLQRKLQPLKKTLEKLQIDQLFHHIHQLLVEVRAQLRSRNQIKLNQLLLITPRNGVKDSIHGNHNNSIVYKL